MQSECWVTNPRTHPQRIEYLRMKNKPEPDRSSPEWKLWNLPNIILVLAVPGSKQMALTNDGTVVVPGVFAYSSLIRLPDGDNALGIERSPQ